jgi:ferredoxin-type protein NapF
VVPDGAPPDGAPNVGRRRLLFGGPASPPSRAPAGVAAAITAGCLAARGIACMSCRDACPHGAIRFVLALGGARPRIEAETCTGCAECARACPADAIAIAAPPRGRSP